MCQLSVYTFSSITWVLSSYRDVFVNTVEVRISDVIYNITVYTVLHAHTFFFFHILNLIESFLMCCDVFQLCPDNIV